MKYVYKLGPKAVSFTDPTTSICITRKNPHTSDNPLHTQKHIFYRAVASGHLIVDQIEEVPDLDQLDINTASAEQFDNFTREEIMGKFDFMDEEDTAKAKACKKKAEFIAFVISIREDY